MTHSANRQRFVVASSCSVLLLALLVFTVQHEFGYAGPPVVLGAEAGCVGIGIYTGRTPPGWFFTHFDSHAPGVLLWPTTAPSTGGWEGVVMPLWIPSVVTICYSVLCWRRSRARLPGHCRKCDYDLTGNVSGVCPECGEKVQRR